MSHIFAHLTCTRVKWESEEQDYPTEEHGWVDYRWNATVLYDNRNDVRPMVDCDLADRETLADEIETALSDLGAYEDNGDGTFYAADSYTPFDGDGWSYSYALHFTRKFWGPRGITEEKWHPKEGGFDV